MSFYSPPVIDNSQATLLDWAKTCPSTGAVDLAGQLLQEDPSSPAYPYGFASEFYHFTPHAEYLASSMYPFTPTAQWSYLIPSTASPADLFGRKDLMEVSPASSAPSLLPREEPASLPTDEESDSPSAPRQPTLTDPFAQYASTPEEKTEPPVKKRSRTAQACEKCRIRKAKCTGETPCSRCISKGLPCVYTPASRARPSKVEACLTTGMAQFKSKFKTRCQSFGHMPTHGSSLPRRHSAGSATSSGTSSSWSDAPQPGGLGLNLGPPSGQGCYYFVPHQPQHTITTGVGIGNLESEWTA